MTQTNSTCQTFACPLWAGGCMSLPGLLPPALQACRRHPPQAALCLCPTRLRKGQSSAVPPSRARTCTPHMAFDLQQTGRAQQGAVRKRVSLWDPAGLRRLFPRWDLVSSQDLELA